MFVKYGPRFYNTDHIYKVSITETSVSDYYVTMLFINGETLKEIFASKVDAENFAFKITQAT